MFNQSQIQIHMLCLQTEPRPAGPKQPQRYPLIIVTTVAIHTLLTTCQAVLNTFFFFFW